MLSDKKAINKKNNESYIGLAYTNKSKFLSSKSQVIFMNAYAQTNQIKIIVGESEIPGF